MRNLLEQFSAAPVEFMRTASRSTRPQRAIVLVRILSSVASTGSLTSLLAKVHFTPVAGRRGLGAARDKQMGFAGAGITDQTQWLAFFTHFDVARVWMTAASMLGWRRVEAADRLSPAAVGALLRRSERRRARSAHSSGNPRYDSCSVAASLPGSGTGRGRSAAAASGRPGRPRRRRRVRSSFADVDGSRRWVSEEIGGSR